MKTYFVYVDEYQGYYVGEYVKAESYNKAKSFYSRYYDGGDYIDLRAYRVPCLDKYDVITNFILAKEELAFRCLICDRCHQFTGEYQVWTPFCDSCIEDNMELFEISNHLIIEGFFTVPDKKQGKVTVSLSSRDIEEGEVESILISGGYAVSCQYDNGKVVIELPQ